MKTRANPPAVQEDGAQDQTTTGTGLPEAPSIVSLEDAENQLRAVAARYNQSGDEQFAVLKMICFLIFSLKQLFEKTPRKLRPRDARTWAKYAPAVAKRCGLRFKSDRMADHYVRLHSDMKAAGVDEIQKRVSDGSYREARKAANDLLNKTGKKLGGPSSCALLQQAARLISKAMEEASGEGHLRSLASAHKTVSNASRADRLRSKDVVPELGTFGLPDVVRHRINFAVRAASGDPVAAGVHALEQSLFDGTHEKGAIALPAWSKPADVNLPPTPDGAAKWLESWLVLRSALIAALIRKFDGSPKPGATEATG